MSLFSVDCEFDGPAPGLYSMISFAIVRIDEDLQTSFKGLVAPISENFRPEVHTLLKITREEHLSYMSPAVVMPEAMRFVIENTKGRAVCIGDNPAGDWQFLNYYFHRFCGENPFGNSARRIGDFYAGLRGDFKTSIEWKKLRTTPHNHDPLNDARGNAEAFKKIIETYGLKKPW